MTIRRHTGPQITRPGRDQQGERPARSGWFEHLRWLTYLRGMKIHPSQLEAAGYVQKEALDIREKARREAADLTQRAQAELRLASQQTLSTLRHALESFLQQKALSEPVRAALQQPDTITGLISLVVDRMALSDAGDPTILLAPEEEAQVRDQLNASLQDVLRQQPLIQPYPGIRAGFRIQEHSGQYQLSFTDEDFIAFLMPYLSQEIQQIIRPDHEAG